MEITQRQKRFVEEYLMDLNAVQAAVRAGYSEKTARKNGYLLLKKPGVAEAVREAMAQRGERVQITQDMVLRELAAIGFAMVTDHTNVSGDGQIRVVPTAELTEEQRRAIASIKVSRYGVQVSNYDKVKALELLGKHLGLFCGREGACPEEENDLLERLVDDLEEDMDTDDLSEIQ